MQPNADFFSTTSLKENDVFEDYIPLRLLFGDTIHYQGNPYILSRDYFVNMRFNPVVIPEIQVTNSKEEQGVYLWQVNCNFHETASVIGNPLGIESVSFTDNRLNTLERGVNFTKVAGTSTLFSGTITLPYDSIRKYGIDHLSVKFDLNIRAKYTHSSSMRNYHRELVINFPYSPKQISIEDISDFVSVTNPKDLLHILDDSVKLGGTNAYRLKSTIQDTTLLISELVDGLNIKYSVDKKVYEIDSTLINKEKYIELVNSRDQ
ncbi:MAG: hypothetical protein RIC35_04275 [Marinoscillum sp.]